MNVLNWLEKIRSYLAVIVFPFTSLKSLLSLWDTVGCTALGDCIISCCRLTSSVCNTPVWSAVQLHNLFWILLYSLSRSVLDVFITQVEAEGSYLKACSQWSTVSYSRGFVSFLSFFSCFKFLDVDSVPWNVNVVSSTIHVNKTSQTAFIWFALSCHVHDKISYHVSYQMNTHRKVIEWLELEGTLRLSPNPPAMTRDIFQEIRLLEAPSNPALNTSRNGVHLTNLTVKNF